MTAKLWLLKAEAVVHRENERNKDLKKTQPSIWRNCQVKSCTSKLLTVHSVAFNIRRRSSIRTTRDTTPPASKIHSTVLLVEGAILICWLSLESSPANRGEGDSSNGSFVPPCDSRESLKRLGNDRRTPINVTPVAKRSSTTAWIGRSSAISCFFDEKSCYAFIP
jgi:hypothetical protein